MKIIEVKIKSQG